MLFQRHRPARFFALAVLAFVITGLWQPGFNRIEIDAQLLRRAPGRRDQPTTATGCSITAPPLHGAERIDDDGGAATGRPSR